MTSFAISLVLALLDVCCDKVYECRDIIAVSMSYFYVVNLSQHLCLAFLMSYFRDIIF